MKCALRTPNLSLEPRASWTQLELSTVNDVTTTIVFFVTEKTCQSVTLSSFVRKAASTGLTVLFAALSRAQRCLTLMNFMSSTRIRSLATKMCWMKKTMDAIAGISRKELVQVALRCNFVNASLKSDRSFIGAFRPDVLRERSTNSFCISCTHRTTCDG